MGQLFAYYKNNFAKNLSVEELIAVACQLSQFENLKFEIKNYSLEVFPDQPEGAIYHPNPKLYQNQWLYVIKNQADFTNFIKNKLYAKQ